MSRLKVLDLFSGIGGFSLGLERAGMETSMFCEIDDTCAAVLKKNFGNIPIWDDVKTLNKKAIDSLCRDGIDVICGGFPCQDISVAGQKRGLEGERSGLWFEFKRLIQEIGPRYAIIENVANLRSKGLARVIKDLWEIGYECEWHIISARSLGAPHLRERIWIIAYPNSSDIREQSGRCPGKERKEKILIGESCKNGTDTNTNSKRERFTEGTREGVHKGFKETVRQDTCYMVGKRIYPSSLTNEQSGRNGDEQESSNSPCIGLETKRTKQQASGTKGDTYEESSHANNLRCWKPFTTEKEALRWWAEAASSVSHWEETQSIICGVDDGISRGLDKARRERIKQLGNSVLPQIPELIGRQIVEFENARLQQN